MRQKMNSKLLQNSVSSRALGLSRVLIIPLDASCNIMYSFMYIIYTYMYSFYVYY